MARSTEMAFAIIFTPHLVALPAGPRATQNAPARDVAPGLGRFTGGELIQRTVMVVFAVPPYVCLLAGFVQLATA